MAAKTPPTPHPPVLEYEGRYQDAIDAIESDPDRRNFEERTVSRLSYLDLKLKRYGRAAKRCKDFLQTRAFNLSYETEIINYEYGKMMENGNVSNKRLSDLAETTQNEMVKGVCYSLLNDDKKTLDIFKTEAERRFSKIDDCLRWPAVSRHHKELLAIKEDLVRAKRSLNELPFVDQITA